MPKLKNKKNEKNKQEKKDKNLLKKFLWPVTQRKTAYSKYILKSVII